MGTEATSEQAGNFSFDWIWLLMNSKVENIDSQIELKFETTSKYARHSI